jgi:precorrin-6Y C5,15-methyltransferase (decarboxylating)
MIFHVIGIGNTTPHFTAKQQECIASTKIFSGGKRHYQLVKHLLPAHHQWITIAAPMANVFDAYESAAAPIIVFASGNPLFYGFSNTLKQKYPNATIATTPYFSAIQLLANAFNLNTNHLQTVSVHGRQWNALDAILIEQKPLIGVLTDTKKTPAAIAQRLLTYGYSNYNIIIGEDIEGKHEQFYALSLAEAAKKEFYPLNCVILQKTHHKPQHFGIPDADFEGLPGRPNMITKMPIRLVTLQYLNILNSTTLWDIGCCTGAISIEAKLKNPQLNIIAFEKREVCENIVHNNQKRFGAPGITTVIGDFFEQDLSQFPKPDTVFIGGHGGRLNELLHNIVPFLAPHTTIVINAVKDTSITTFTNTCKALEFKIIDQHVISIDQHNPITLIKAKSSAK